MKIAFIPLKALIALSALLILSPGTTGAQRRTTPPAGPFSALQFGARPDDGKDDTRSLRKAAEYCRTHPGTTLLIPAGKYQITDPEARQLEADVLAGKLSGDPEKKMFVPYFP